MFRFSIRELMLVTLVVALAVGWWVEHGRAATQGSRLRSALAETARVKAEASAASEKLASFMAIADKVSDEIRARSREESEELERHGLTLYPVAIPICVPPDFDFGKLPKMPVLSKLGPDGKYSEIKADEPVGQP
jgi:hypothetical protein